MSVGVLVLVIRIPGCRSLKEKRGRLRPLMNKLYKDFKVSVAEVDDLDIWGQAVVACALVSNDSNHTKRVLQKAANWVEDNWRDVELVETQIEIL